MIKYIKFKGTRGFKEWAILDMSVICPNGKQSLIPVVALFGKNASGKTGVIKILRDIADDMLGIKHISVLVDKEQQFKQMLKQRGNRAFLACNEEAQMDFEVCFICNDKEFVLSYSIDKKGFVSEKLIMSYENSSETIYAYQRGEEASFSNNSIFDEHAIAFWEFGQRGLLLFCWVMRFPKSEMQELYEYLKFFGQGLLYEESKEKDLLKRAAGLVGSESNLSKRCELQKDFHKRILYFLKCFDDSINDINKCGNTGQLKIYYVDHHHNSSFYMNEVSSGTRKIVWLFTLLNETLKKGGVIAIDDLDKHLHGAVLVEIIWMFRCPETNPGNARLIFSAHNTVAMSSDALNKDCVYITDKSEFGTLSIQRLCERKDVTRYPNMELDFRVGYYGSSPRDFHRARMLWGSELDSQINR